MSFNRLRKQLLLPFDFAWLMWEAAMFFTDNWYEAIKFYHGMVAEFMETINPNY